MKARLLLSAGEMQKLKRMQPGALFSTVFGNVFVPFDSDLRPGFLFYFVRAIKKINL